MKSHCEFHDQNIPALKQYEVQPYKYVIQGYYVQC